VEPTLTEHSLGKLHADYLRWHPAQVASKDIDPVYPVLSLLADAWDLDEEERAWLCFTHVVWYHPGSTLVGYELMPDYTWIPSSDEGLWKSGLLELPCETERRGHRPKQPLINHLLGLRKTFTESEGCRAWVDKAVGTSDDPHQRWLDLNQALTTLVGNGRWAAYKTAEMLQKICDVPVEAPDAGHRYSSGPRKGLMILEPRCPVGQTEDDIATLDMMTAMWADLLQEPDIAQVETSLCDFNSLVHGRYYLGHDIDSMQHAFLAMGDRLPKEAWEAREATFDSKFLGELNGWTGVRKDANRHYKLTGELLYV
jgi:hypothetical protein